MKKLIFFVFFLATLSLVSADSPFVIGKNASFPQSAQVRAKELRFEVDAVTKESVIAVNPDAYVYIECDELILDGTIIFTNASDGDNINSIKIEIRYKTMSGPGKIINGITPSYKGNANIIFSQRPANDPMSK